jgi:3'-phosphoadenosine 5'-phosphosulfate sulfotransferase (PAPS reductase)/FAD synthetase
LWRLKDLTPRAARLGRRKGEMTLYHVGISGGKDSTAVLLWMVHESGIPRDQIIATFADTGNEAQQTYDHIKLISEMVHPVETIKPPLDFYELARKKGRFPSTKARFCTQDLKMKPSKEYIDNLLRQGYDVIPVSGVRADESRERALLPEWDNPMNNYYGLKGWRPILKWTIVEVVAIHKKYGVPLNPLYSMGAQRVGCFPCIMSRKSEIRNIVKNFPERIDVLREQEWMGENKMLHTFFARNKVPPEFRSKPIVTKSGETINVATIDDVVAWSRTKDRKRSKGQMALDFWHEEDEPVDAWVCPASMGACE